MCGGCRFVYCCDRGKLVCGAENVNINMIATSEIRITVLVNSEDAVRAMNAVHDAFGLAEA